MVTPARVRLSLLCLATKRRSTALQKIFCAKCESLVEGLFGSTINVVDQRSLLHGKANAQQRDLQRAPQRAKVIEIVAASAVELAKRTKHAVATACIRKRTLLDAYRTGDMNAGIALDRRLDRRVTGQASDAQVRAARK